MIAAMDGAARRTTRCASAEQLTDQIRSVWPELGEIQVSEVQAAIEALVEAGLVVVEAGLVEGVCSAVDTAGVA